MFVEFFYLCKACKLVHIHKIYKIIKILICAENVYFLRYVPWYAHKKIISISKFLLESVIFVGYIQNYQNLNLHFYFCKACPLVHTQKINSSGDYLRLNIVL